MRRAALAAALLLAAGALPGCAAGYIARAAYEEARLLWRREPIAPMLQGDDLDPTLRAKLEVTLAARRFAADELGLRVGGSYASLATVDAGQIVHVVSAAPRDRLEPYTWWFPIVGRVPYRGYFARGDADALAAALHREGYDTDVRPAVAFSTLGWFDDPLLSSMLRSDDERLVETVLHELTHATVYVPGESAFNESLATFVGHRGSERFFAARGDATRANRASARWADALTFSAFLAGAVDRLRAAYAVGIDEADRQALFTTLQRDAARRQWLTDEYAGFWRRPLNNAALLQAELYASGLDRFEAVEACDGDLRRTVVAIHAAVASAPDPFAALAELCPSSTQPREPSSPGPRGAARHASSHRP
jgi:predicted aminopeptidase